MKNEQGNTIVVTMIVVTTFAALISISFDFTSAMDKNGKRAEAYQAAANIADGLLDQAYTVWKTASQTRGAVGEITTSDLATRLSTYTPVSASVAIGAKGFYYTQDNTLDSLGFKKDFKITHIDGYGNDITTSVTPAKTAEDYLRPTRSGGGLLNLYYKAHVGVSVPIGSRTGPAVRVQSNRYFVKRFKSPWNFAIFYNNTLEIHPGPDMIINGWIHSNGTLYSAQNSLHMMGRVTFGDGFEGNYGPGDNRRISGSNLFPTSADIYSGGTDLVSGGSVSNGYLDNWTSTSPPAAGEKQQVIDLQPTAFDPLATGTYGNNDDGFQEIIQAPNPAYPDLQEIADQRFYNKSDMLVEIKNNSFGTTEVSIRMKTSEDASGNSVYGSPSVYNTTVTNPIFSPGKTVRDNRWGGNVDVTDVDISQIKAQVDATTLPSAMSIYVYDSRGTSSTRKGIRLVRGASLPNGGLTIISQNPIYVQGDYNTNGTYATNTSADRIPLTQPASNGATPDQTKPTITGTVQRPAAIIGDAVTILSNAWNDATVNSSSSTVTNATKTTVNTAILTGNVATTTGKYSGGAENFPRFLENWTNIEFTYWGSMVQMFQSQQANEPWGKSNVYEAPRRRWNFDSRLINNAPPGTPKLISYSKTEGRWFLE